MTDFVMQRKFQSRFFKIPRILQRTFGRGVWV